MFVSRRKFFSICLSLTPEPANITIGHFLNASNVCERRSANIHHLLIHDALIHDKLNQVLIIIPEISCRKKTKLSVHKNCDDD